MDIKSDLDLNYYQDNSAEKENIEFNVINDVKDNFNEVISSPDFDKINKCVENQNILSHSLNENKLINNELNSESIPLNIKNKIKNSNNGKEVPFSQ